MYCLLLVNTLTNRTLSVNKKANRVCFDFTSTLKYIYKSHLRTCPVRGLQTVEDKYCSKSDGFQAYLDVKREQTLVYESLCTISAAN